MNMLQQIGDQVRSRLGTHLGPHKDYLLEARLERLKVKEGYRNLEDFHRDLKSGDGRALDALARHMTTNHTYFFREAEHFPLHVRLLRQSGTSRVRLWSAAGSTGEEGYTLAMVLAEAGFQDFLVLVSDVNREVIAQAHQGVYDPGRMGKVPPELVDRYFVRREDGSYQVLPVLRAKLRFRCINLIEELEIGEYLDVIFCRNLLIYFDDAGIRQVLDRLAEALKPGGHLFLGQSEGFHRPPPGLKRVGPSVYQKAT
jgi:chemotaxis protein methyltransferase CheR